ncbi:MAG: class I SAM-dependent methyltransferase [Candidatus Brocadiaceae bacterium]|nr:class I SAM-dependent methyltransferase [Candidatus Brocadiaceae bacterium]
MPNQKHPPTPEKLLKKEGRDIRQMFASIAPTYDLLNSLLSLGFDARWRRRVVDLAGPSPDARVLDLCAGTAELALAFAQRLDPKGYVVASDFCWEMLELARPKLKKRTVDTDPIKSPSPGGRGKGEGDTYGGATACPVVLLQADALCLPFPDKAFDVVSVAFGIRNVSNLTQGLKEMVRVVKPGGKVIILEFSLPAGPIFSRLYNFYFNKLLPWVGNSISAGSGPATAPGRLRAYSYLPASVVKFARPEELKREMESCGLTEVEYHPLTLGIVTVYAGKRP